LISSLRLSLNSDTISPAALTRSAVAQAEAAVLLQVPTTFGIVPEDDEKGASIPELKPFATATTTFPRHCASVFLDPAKVAALASCRPLSRAKGGFQTKSDHLLACGVLYGVGDVPKC
jgi:hypothetical protein